MVRKGRVKSGWEAEPVGTVTGQRTAGYHLKRGSGRLGNKRVDNSRVGPAYISSPSSDPATPTPATVMGKPEGAGSTPPHCTPH